jgi:hypothetical protein
MFRTAVGKSYPLRLGVLALTVFVGEGCTTKEKTQVHPANPYWELAWKAANTIPSPIDVGTTKAQICDAAALSGQLELLGKWRADEQVPWVRVSCDLSRAYAEALYGKAENHDALLQTTVNEAKQIDEWDQSRITNPLLKAHVAGLWQKSQDFQAMKKWILEDELKRMPMAAQFFCDWLTLQRQHAKGDITHNASIRPIMDLLMAQRQKYLPAQRIRLFAVLSPFLKGTPWEATVRQEVGEQEMPLSKADCETLLIISRIHAGLGALDKADALITRAQGMIEANETGDCLAPWALLAEAKAAAGRTPAEIAQALDLGLQRASDRPGYFKPVAIALTYAMRAQLEMWTK